jgi:hypothetical protein
MKIRRWIRLAGTTLLALALILVAGAVVVDPMNQRKIRIGSYALQIPKGVTFERTDTGEYRLLLDQKTDRFINMRELATVAGRGLLGEVSGPGMIRKVVGTRWFPRDTRVCLADGPEANRGLETWAVQYYRQTFFDGDGLAYRFRHGVLVVRNRANGGGMVMDVSRMDDPADRVVIDWGPVRARLRTLLRNTEPRPDRPRGAWADAASRLKALWAALLRQPKEPAPPSPLDVRPPRSVPVCLGPYQLQRDQLDDQPVPRDEGWERYGGYQLSLRDGLKARVAYRAEPFRDKDLVGFDNLRPRAGVNWLSDGECVRGLGVPDTFHNKRGAKQRYERFSNGRRHVGVMAVVATTTPGNLIFDVFYPWPVDQEVQWTPLETYLDDLRLAVIVGDFTAPDQGGERDRSLDVWPCAT